MGKHYLQQQNKRFKSLFFVGSYSLCALTCHLAGFAKLRLCVSKIDRTPPPSEATASWGLAKLNEELKFPFLSSSYPGTVQTASILGL